MIRKWKRHHRHWKDALLVAPLPFLPRFNSLRALAYVDVWDRFIPETIVRHLRRADLLWYIDNKKPSAFWAGARLDDEDWRRENGMAKGPGCCPQVHYDVSKLMRVQKIVFDNNLIPKNTFMDL